jgi:hypothetical protein
LQRQRAAGEDGGEAHNGQREPADMHQRMQEFARVEGGAEEMADHLCREKRDTTDGCQSGQHGPPDSGKGSGKRGHACPAMRRSM